MLRSKYQKSVEIEQTPESIKQLEKRIGIQSFFLSFGLATLIGVLARFIGGEWALAWVFGFLSFVFGFIIISRIQVMRKVPKKYRYYFALSPSEQGHERSMGDLYNPKNPSSVYRR